MTYKKYLITLLLILTSGSMHSLPLTLEDAIQSALSHHFDVQLSKLAQDIAQKNHTLGKAGVLPSLDASTQLTQAQTDDLTRTSNITTRTQNLTTDTTLTALTLNWTLFDGFSSYFKLNRLGKLAELSQLQVTQTIETAIRDVTTAYIDTAILTTQVSIALAKTKLAQDALSRATLKSHYGTQSTTDHLIAHTQFSTAKSDLHTKQLALNTAKHTLSFLTGIPVDDITTLNPPKTVSPSLELLQNDQLKPLMLAKNTTLKMAKANTRLSQLDASLIASALAPKITLSGGYLATQIDTNTGTYTHRDQEGLSGTLKASFNIFNGFQDVTTHKTAKIANKYLQLTQEKVKSNLLHQCDIAQATYKTLLSQLDLAHPKLATATQALKRAEILYQAGQLSTNEFELSQLDHRLAQADIDTLHHQLQLTQLTLLTLSGTLLTPLP